MRYTTQRVRAFAHEAIKNPTDLRSVGLRCQSIAFKNLRPYQIIINHRLTQILTD